VVLGMNLAHPLRSPTSMVDVFSLSLVPKCAVEQSYWDLFQQ
jgi:hypothetical protein